MTVISSQDVIFLVTTPLSIIGELSVLVTFFKHPQLLFNGAVYISFIFFQVFATFLLSVKMLISTVFTIIVGNLDTLNNNTQIDESVCFALGITDQFSYAATVIWDFMITIQILWLLRKVGGAQVGGFDFEESKRYWNMFAHTVVWGLSLTSAIVPAALGQYRGSSLNGCYISDEFMLTILVVSLIPMIFFMFCSFMTLLIALWNRTEFIRKQEYIKQVGTPTEINQFPKFNLLVGFSCVFIFHWLPYVCLRLLDQIDLSYRTTYIWTILSYAQMISFTTQGISSAIVWHFSRTMDVEKEDGYTALTQPELGDLTRAINSGELTTTPTDSFWDGAEGYGIQ